MQLNQFKKNDSLLICGHGKSLDKIQHLPEIDIMTVNDWYNVRKWKPDFVVCTNPWSKIYPDYSENIDLGTKYFFRYKENCKIDYIAYSWRGSAGIDLCKMFKDKTGREIGMGDSTIIICFILSVCMGYRTVYHIGTEIDARVGYAGLKNEKRLRTEKHSTPDEQVKYCDFLRPRITRDINIIKNAGYSIGMEFINFTFMHESKIKKIL